MVSGEPLALIRAQVVPLRGTFVQQQPPRTAGLRRSSVRWISERLLLDLLGEPQPLDRISLDAAGHVVLVAKRLGRSRLREVIDRERLPHSIDGLPELLGAERIADPKAGEAVDLRERPQEDEVREALQ